MSTGKTGLLGAYLQSDLDCTDPATGIKHSIIGLPSSSALLSIDKTIYVDGTNGSSSGMRGTTKAFQTLAQAIAIAQNGDQIVFRPGTYASTGLHTISQSNLFISGYGAIISASSEGDVQKISITGSNNTIVGLEINGNRASNSVTADSANGAIEISGSGNIISDCYIHDSLGHGVRMISGAGQPSNCSVIRTHIKNTSLGVSVDNPSAAVLNPTVSECFLDNTRRPGIGFYGNAGSTSTDGAEIVGNRLYSCGVVRSTEALVLFGSGNNSRVRGNLVKTSVYGISYDNVHGSQISNNIVLDYTFVGIEFADGCSNISSSDNYIYNSVAGAGPSSGYGISTLNNNPSAAINITGGVIDTPGRPVAITGQNDIHIRDVTVYLRSNPLFFQTAINTTVKGCTFNAVGVGMVFGIIEHYSDTVQTTGFEFSGNVIHGSPVAEIIGMFGVNGGGFTSPVVINNTTDGTTVSTGYIRTSGVITTPVIGGNLPRNTNNLSGFYATQFQESWASSSSIAEALAAGNSSAAASSKSAAFNLYGTDTAGTLKKVAQVVAAGLDQDFVGCALDLYTRAADALVKVVRITTTNLDSVGLSVAGNAVETVNHKAAANGYPSLDGSGKVPAAQLPTLSAGTIASTTAVLKGDGAGNAIASIPTGTGDNVLATSPTLVTPVLGVATATSVNKWVLTAPATSATINAGADGLTYGMPEITTLIGFRHIPQNSKSANYTTVLADSGKNIYHPVGDNNARTFTIDSNANVAYPIGTGMLFTNMAVANLTVAVTSDTLTLLGTGTTGSRIIAQYGRLYVEKDTVTSWIGIPIANVT